jgi:hypothetical protein
MHRYVHRTIFVVVVVLLIVALFFAILVVQIGETNRCNLHDANLNYLLNPNVADIVITLTTMPDRLQSNEFKKVLSSMFEQTVRPRDIRLNVPHVSKRTGKEYIIPNWLHNVAITIVRCEDFGPATKYIPSLKHFSDINKLDQRLLIYDDDSIMPRNLVETFDAISRKYPQYCVTTNTYRFLDGSPRFRTFGFQSQLSWAQKILYTLTFADCREMPPNDEVTLTDMAVGWCGFLMTPNMVNFEDVSNFESLPPDAFFVDDVVISASILKHGTQIVVGRGLDEAKLNLDGLLSALWTTMTKGPSESLKFSDNKEQSHDAVMQDYYREHWQFLKESKRPLIGALVW